MFRRISAALVLGLVALLVLALPASAGVSWCRADPIVSLNGQQVQIWVAVPAEYAAKVTGPVEVTIKIPAAVSREVLMTDAGFNGYGERVVFQNSSALLPGNAFYLTVGVKVPMNGVVTPVPVQVEVVMPNGARQYYYGSQWWTSGMTLLAPTS